LARILLVNPPSAIDVYSSSKIRVAITSAPFVTLGALAGAVLEDGHQVRIADLMIEARPIDTLRGMLSEWKPDYIGITFTTPLASEAQALARVSKEILPDSMVIAGGVHASTLPEEVLKPGAFDVVVMGEGENTLRELCSGEMPGNVNGTAFLKNGELVCTPPRELIADLDNLPMPAWQLYDLQYYRSPHIASRKNPVGYMETNRGCNHHCTYCSQSIFGHKVREKSPERVVDEMFRMLELGFNDIHIKDNNFTADIERAKKVCRLLIERKFPAPWALPTGVNVHDVDRDFFRLAAAAGCYQVAFGIESASAEVLQRVGKRQSTGLIADAVRMAHLEGIETVGFFMIGLPGDTKETIMESIRFACSIPLTYAKASMTLPFPSSALFRQIDREGRIKSKNWDMYNFHCTTEVWEHENLTWSEIQKYYGLFHRKFYFRPSYIWKRFWSDLRRGCLWEDAKAVLSNNWAD
jgi:anaerobic magnesium-protoporphyrin IX monomethyl ester cyclase